MLAGSDIPAEAFPCHLILGTGLPARSLVVLWPFFIWTGVTGHPGWDTPRRCLQPSTHKVPSSSVTSQAQILVHLWKTLLVPYSSLIQPCTYSLRDLPFGAATDRINCPNRSVIAEEAGTCPYKGSGPSFVQRCLLRDYKWKYLSVFILLRRYQSSDSSELQHGHRLAAGVTLLGACQVLLPPGKLQVKFVESFWALSRFQLILTLTVLLDNFFPQLSRWKNSQLSKRYFKIHLIFSCTVN